MKISELFIIFTSKLGKTHQYCLGLKKLREELAPREVRTFGVFRGPQEAKFGEIEVLPLGEFLSRLWSGRVF